MNQRSKGLDDQCDVILHYLLYWPVYSRCLQMNVSVFVEIGL